VCVCVCVCVCVLSIYIYLCDSHHPAAPPGSAEDADAIARNVVQLRALLAFFGQTRPLAGPPVPPLVSPAFAAAVAQAMHAALAPHAHTAALFVARLARGADGDATATAPILPAAHVLAALAFYCVPLFHDLQQLRLLPGPPAPLSVLAIRRACPTLAQPVAAALRQLLDG
jgi:hypothetical protein